MDPTSTCITAAAPQEAVSGVDSARGAPRRSISPHGPADLLEAAAEPPLAIPQSPHAVVSGSNAVVITAVKDPFLGCLTRRKKRFP